MKVASEVRLLERFLSLIIFLGCASFVAYRQRLSKINMHFGALALGVLGVSSKFWAKIHIFYFFQFLRIFVYRGYECFTKYSTKPQSNKISYKFNAGVPFPLILFCPDDDNMFKAEELTKCNLIPDDYFENGQWVGKSKDPDCTDPKAFYLWLILLYLWE